MINIKGKELEIKFTYNSMRYMQDFDVTSFGEIESKPFKAIGLLKELMFAGMNHNPKVVVGEIEIDGYIESSIEEGKFQELMEEVINKLNESDFFQSLQKTKPKKK
jgi:hypothetical protein